MQARSAWRERAEPEIPDARPRPRPAGSRPYVSQPVEPDRRPGRPRSEHPPPVMILAPALGLAIWVGILALFILIW